MRNPLRKLVYALAALGAGALLIWLSTSGRLGPEDSVASLGAGMGGFVLLCLGGYFVPASLRAARGRARLIAGADVVVRWPVSAADWERFRAIDLAASGVRAPALDGLQFIPGSCPAADGTEIIVGPASVLVGDYFLSFTPRHGERWAESVHWLATNPRCIALVIVSSPVGGKFGRWLLLLPVPETARDAGSEAMRHYNSVLSRP